VYARLLIVAAEIFLQIKKKMFPAEIKCSTTFYVWFIHRDLLPATKHAPLFFLMSMYYPLKNHKGGRHYLPFSLQLVLYFVLFIFNFSPYHLHGSFKLSIFQHFNFILFNKSWKPKLFFFFNDLSHSLSLGYLNTHPFTGLKIEKIKTSGGQS
jgi:hypothetical protein